jgi:hypothetical protein
MASSIVPTERELKGIDLNANDLADLVRQAEQSDAADRQLTIGQALKQYKAATFWAMILSTSLIMEGFDLVTVSLTVKQSFLYVDLSCSHRLTPSTVKNNSRTGLVSMFQDLPARKLFRRVGNLGCQTQLWLVSSLVYASIYTPRITLDVGPP